MGADLHRHDGRDVDDRRRCDHLIVVDENLGKVVVRIASWWRRGTRGQAQCIPEGEVHRQPRPIAHETFEVRRACIHLAAV